MAVTVIAGVRELVPADDLLPLIEDLVGWQERYQDRMSTTSFFGTSIMETDGDEAGVIHTRDDDDLEDMIAEWPLRPYCEIEIRRDGVSVDNDWIVPFDGLASRREPELVALA